MKSTLIKLIIAFVAGIIILATLHAIMYGVILLYDMQITGDGIAIILFLSICYTLVSVLFAADVFKIMNKS